MVRRNLYIGRTATRVHVYPIYATKNKPSKEEPEKKEAEGASENAVISCAVDLNMDVAEAVEEVNNNAVITPDETVEVKALEDELSGKDECIESVEAPIEVLGGAEPVEVPAEPKKRGGRKKKTSEEASL